MEPSRQGEKKKKKRGRRSQAAWCGVLLTEKERKQQRGGGRGRKSRPVAFSSAAETTGPPDRPEEVLTRVGTKEEAHRRSLMLSLSFCRCFAGVVPAKRSPKLVVSRYRVFNSLFVCISWMLLTQRSAILGTKGTGV